MDNFKIFSIKESLYDIDNILDKINNSGIDSLTFYEIQVLKNPQIQKKLLYQYEMSLQKVKELLNIFNIDSKSIYIDETFYIDGEIQIGDYNGDKFHEVINKIGKNNFILLDEYGKKFIKNVNVEEVKNGYVGRMEYTKDIRRTIRTYPICINFYKDRYEFVFYQKNEDEIIEITPNYQGFKFNSIKNIEKYINILKEFLEDIEILEDIENYINKNLKDLL